MPNTDAHDQELFDRFINEHGDKAFRYAYVTLHSRPDAEDVVQDAFLRLWRHAMRRGVETLSAPLLFHTVTNLCRDRMRHLRRHPEDPTDLLEVTHAAAEDTTLLSDSALVLDAVMRLNPAERQCILLFYYLDRSLKETADALGVSEQVVKTRLYRARQHLKPLLEPVWKESSL
ncbi:MAG: sigma-70 family RNA polymerase sigma factor [Firmicutes bacterium]|nr:sigma-70 family RNA polymerase sigma factor [Bacillota bacterium]